MVNTRLMSRLFSATNEKDSELTEQVANDIESAKVNGSVDTDELKFEHVGDGKVAITDKENGEVTVAEKAEDGNYDLYPYPTENLEGFIHPESDGVTPGDQKGEELDTAENHLDGEKISELDTEDSAEDEEPCECESDEEEKKFSVDNSVIMRIFNDQAFCERLFSETLESGESTLVGNLKIEKDDEDEDSVIVADTATGDSAKVTMNDDELVVNEIVETKNFNDNCECDECDDNDEYEPLHVVGVNVDGHEIIDAPVPCEKTAQDLADRLEEIGVDSVEIFDNPDEARDYAIDLLENLGADGDSIEEPEQVEFSDTTIYVTKFYSNNTELMDRLFSEAENDIDASQNDIEEAIENGEVATTDHGETIIPVSDDTAIIESKDGEEYTKVVLCNDTIKCEAISREDAEEETEKAYSQIYCDESETKFFSEHENLTNYMTRLFSGDADEKDIEEAIEGGEQIETDNEIITPVDSETAVIEDKESGEFTKATMDDEKIDVNPISEEEADELTKDLLVEDKDEDEEAKEDEPEAKEEEEKPEEAEEKTEEEKPAEEEKPEDEKPAEEAKEEVAEDEKKDEEEEKKFSTLDKFFSDAIKGEDEKEEEESKEDVPSAEAIEDKAVAAVQSIQAAAAEAEAAILNAKAAPAENQEEDLKEAEFSQKSFSDTDHTLVSWMSGHGLGK